MKKRLFIPFFAGILLAFFLALIGKDLSNILAYKIYFLERLFSFIDSERNRDFMVIEVSNILSCFIIVWGGIIFSKLEILVYRNLGSERYRKLDKTWDIFYNFLSKFDEKFENPSPVRSCILYLRIFPIFGLFYNSFVFVYFETKYYLIYRNLLINPVMPYEFLFLIFSCFLGFNLIKYVEIRENFILTRIPDIIYILFFLIILNFVLIGYLELYYIYG